MKPHIKKISELTGFSPATVSNAFSGKRSVNKKTAAQIFRTAKENGLYVESKISRIKFINFKNSGIVCADTPFFAAVIDGVMEERRRAGYDITFCTLQKTNPNYEDLLTQVLNDTSYALLILATEMDEEDAKRFVDFPNPIVMLDCWFDHTRFNTVLHSNFDSALQATEYLFKCGHKEIGYLMSNIRIKNFQHRQLGYERAHENCGIPVCREYFYPLTPTMEDAYNDMFDLLEQGIKLPSALLADNDNIALGAMKALKQHGYKIPADISIVGFDDIPFCTISSPGLTTIKVYKQEMGKAAVNRITELINNSSTSNIRTKIEVCNELIVRESVLDLTKQKVKP